MTKWNTIRRASGLIEHICEHGVGHPNQGSALWVAEERGEDQKTWLVHGCDGCCGQDDFPGTVFESLKNAHKIIRGLKANLIEKGNR